jgi:hypothetical protein
MGITKGHIIFTYIHEGVLKIKLVVKGKGKGLRLMYR